MMDFRPISTGDDGPVCVACEVDLAPKSYPKTGFVYETIFLVVGLVLGSAMFFIPLFLVPPGIHYIWNCCAVCMVYGIYMGAGLMQPKKLVIMNYCNFCIIGPLLCTFSFVSGPGRYYASPPGKYLVGTAWLLHGVADTFHHPNLCCSNSKKNKFGLAVFHPQFCWEPIGCMSFDILFGLLTMYVGPDAPMLS